jgi:hypothetical protein
MPFQDSQLLFIARPTAKRIRFQDQLNRMSDDPMSISADVIEEEVI